ncbi:MAG: hypothetical protein K8T25_22120 [Planctomycetia bacterium]|nr:hypothetical protein [Planctomycetia bacterium]
MPNFCATPELSPALFFAVQLLEIATFIMVHSISDRAKKSILRIGHLREFIFAAHVEKLFDAKAQRRKEEDRGRWQKSFFARLCV